MPQYYFTAAVLGYLCGCLNLAHLIAKQHNQDIKTTGNGNPGAGNVTLNFGIKFGALTCAFDILKAIIPGLISKTLYPNIPYIHIIAASFAVLGHMFPFYRKFNGGKGFASFIGLTFCTDWHFGLAVLTGAIIVALFWDYIIGATFTFIICLPLYAIFKLENHHVAFLIAMISIIIACKHIENFDKIKAGTEPRLSKNIFKKKVRK